MSETISSSDDATRVEGSEAIMPAADAARTAAETAPGTPRPRFFIYDGRKMPDPDPRLDPEQVRQQLAALSPDLASATTSMVVVDGEEHYTFTKRIGTKGAAGGVPTRERPRLEDGRVDVIGVLRDMPEYQPPVFALLPRCLTATGEIDVAEARRHDAALRRAYEEADREAKRIAGAIRGLLAIPPL